MIRFGGIWMFTFSEEHKDYLKKIKNEKLIVFFFRFLIFFVFIFLWEFLAQNSIINTFLFSSPSKVLETIESLYSSGELLKHIGVSIYEVFISFFLASGIGILVATLLWSNERLSKIIDPYITILNSLPKVALGPLIIIWVGASINSIIFMALMISVFVTIINIYNGFMGVNENYITMLRSFGASKWQIYKKIVFPSNIENIISAFKVNISMSLIGVIMGELLVSKNGIGYLIMYGSQVFNIDLVITGVMILGAISYIMYVVIDKIEFYVKKRRS